MIELPTIEDVRDYPFNTLKPASAEQQELVREMVRRGMLYRKEGDDEHEQLRPEATFNPTIQYFYQAVFHRALEGNDEIPELDLTIRNYITPEARIFEESQPLMKEVHK